VRPSNGVVLATLTGNGLSQPTAAAFDGERVLAHAEGPWERAQRIFARYRAPIFLVLAYLMRFKQICNHPAHFLGDRVWDEAGSGKLARLREILEAVAAKQEKVLVFTQFREATEPLAAFQVPKRRRTVDSTSARGRGRPSPPLRPRSTA
jgi:hypothetical protein